MVSRNRTSRYESVDEEMRNETTHFCAQGGLVLEVVVAKYWANLGEVVLDYSLAFHGVKSESPSITMQGADGILSLELRSGLRSEEIAPVVTLKNTVQVIRWAARIEIFFPSSNVFWLLIIFLSWILSIVSFYKHHHCCCYFDYVSSVYWIQQNARSQFDT